MHLLKELVAKHSGISTSKIICCCCCCCCCCCFYCCVVLLLYSCCCCVLFAVVLLLCCCCFVLFVVLFDIGRAISLSRIPSKAFYQKPKWFFLWCRSPRGSRLPSYPVSTITLTHTHTHTHIWYDSSGRTISPAQRPLPHNTHIHTHTKETDIYAPSGIRNRNAGQERVRRPTSENAWLLESASSDLLLKK